MDSLWSGPRRRLDARRRRAAAMARPACAMGPGLGGAGMERSGLGHALARLHGAPAACFPKLCFPKLCFPGLCFPAALSVPATAFPLAPRLAAAARRCRGATRR